MSAPAPRRAPWTQRPAREHAFVGRGADLEQLERLVEGGAALVTITGAAGIGKSALAASFAASMGKRSGNEARRTVFCRLEEAREAAGFRAVLAAALGMPAVEGADESETAALFTGSLAAIGPALLVLDDFEHLVPFASATVETWLAEIPELQILVTSRERLRADCEVVHELGPLSLPKSDDLSHSEAAQLWLARARERSPSYVVEPADAPVIARLVRELDGLPLAIELAAARFGTLTPHELLRRIEQSLDVLGVGARAGRKASTLRGALEWSWSLLEPWERSAFAQCAVFRGSIAIDAVEAILELGDEAPAHEAIDAVQALRDKSLLIYAPRAGADETSEPSLRMFASVRKLAEDKLAARADATAVLGRHARYFLAYAERCAALVRTDLTTAARLLSAERENLLSVVHRALASRAPEDLETALRILMALEEPRWHHGSPSAHLGLFDDVLVLPGARDVAPPVRARALIARARIAWRTGRPDAGESDLDEAVAIAVRAADVALESLARRYLALMLLLRGRTDASRVSAEHALRLAQQLGDAGLEGMAKSMLVFIARQSGHHELARRLIEQALDLFREVGDSAFELTMRIELVHVYLDSGELDAARAHAEQALALNTALGLPPHARLLLGLGHAALEAADPAAAIERYREAREAARAGGERAGELLAAACGALALFELGRVLEAQIELRDARRSAYPFGRHLYSGLAAALLGVIEARLGHFAEARELLAAAERDLAATEHGPHHVALDFCRAFCELAEASQSKANGDDATALEERARRRLASAFAAASDSGAGRLAEVRLLARLLGHGRVNEAPLPSAAPRTLRLAADGRWFEPPDGPRVGCGTRPVMRRMLLALAHAHAATPPHPLSSERLIEAGWPGERILPEAAKNRLHVMVSRMRDLGLRQLLLGSDSGYFLSGDVAVSFG